MALSDGGIDPADGPGSRNATRVVRAIEYLARSGGGRIDDLADALGVHKSNASRLLAVLRDVGWVTANDSRTWFVIGPRLAAVGASAVRQGRLSRAREIAHEIRAELGETVHVSIPDPAAHAMLVVACLESTATLRVAQPVGHRDELLTTAVGKVYLASLPDDALERELAELSHLVGGPVAPETAFRSQVELIRSRRFAINNQESRDGVVAGAFLLAPDESGTGAFAISVAAPAQRWSAGAAVDDMAILVERYEAELGPSPTPHPSV